MAVKNKVALSSFDGQMFLVDNEVVQESPFWKKHAIPGKNNVTPNIRGETLCKVLEYCKMHVDSRIGELALPEAELKEWDANFVGQLDYRAFVRLANVQ
jgi:hypothetical protein